MQNSEVRCFFKSYYHIKSELALLEYHINQDRWKVWMYVDRVTGDAKIADVVAGQMFIENSSKVFSDKDREVLQPLFDRYSENEKKYATHSKNLLSLADSNTDNGSH